MMPTLPDNQIGQLNVAMSRADSSVPNVLDGLSRLANGNPHQFSPSSIQNNFVQSYPVLPNQEAGQKQVLQPNSGNPLVSLPFKRKAMIDRTQDNRGPQKMSAPNKRVAQVAPYATSPSASQVSVPKKISSKTGTASRKVVQIQPITNEYRSNTTKKNVQPKVSPTGQTESHESVRAKLRESIASALALVSQELDSYQDGEVKIEDVAIAANNEGQIEHKPFDGSLSNEVAPLESTKDGKSHVSSSPKDESSLSYQSREIFRDTSQTESFLGTNFQCNSVLPGDGSSFSSDLYFKDDFLQGNGLSWESDLNLHVPKVTETGNEVKPELMNPERSINVERKKAHSPESMALTIESELFKLYGGVNKKYKEKGRSLMFNLKDRNNPELRERVMSGDLPPERLCSMTPEELASKELSQWRIAKAEELDNMKVLPETDPSLRRLVKKTHKGEYEVDFTLDADASAEIPVDLGVASSKRSQIDKFDGAASPKVKRTKGDQCEITLPSDGADMQVLMGDDLNDLPPVISLDEFMESLNQDPPFENLPVDPLTTKGESDKENVELGSRRLSPLEAPTYPVQKMSPEKAEVKKESPKSDSDQNLTGIPKPVDTYSTSQLHKRECVWEGQLQLNLSSMASFMSLYKSGEKASCKEWAGFVDIKGRVRHAAFDKFLQALPMSRSRTVMVCHFVLTDESERASLKELVDSYVADERVGFAEPGNGVEIYLCAPHSKTVDMIVNHLPKSYTDKLNEIDDGLIGIVVWRKPQITSISSPKPPPQPVTKKENRSQFVNSNVNKNNVLAPKRASSPPPILSRSQLAVEDDDDAPPPGFGPCGPREDDDLPEFQFSGGSHRPQVPSLQVDQMRKLIQKYGQNGSNTVNHAIPTTQQWNDDDDDIPEWQPQSVHHSVNHQPHMLNNAQMLQHPLWPPNVHPVQPLQPLQPPMGVQHQRAWGLPNNSQFYGSPGPGSGHSLGDGR